MTVGNARSEVGPNGLRGVWEGELAGDRQPVSKLAESI